MNNYILTKDGNFYSVDNNTDNELYHYGVLGMKWGIRRAQKKGQNYTYKSHGQRKWDKKLNKATNKGTNSAKIEKATRKLSMYKTRDKARQSYAESTTVGKTVVRNLLLGPFSNGSYTRLRASGMSRLPSAAISILAYPVEPFLTKTVENSSAGARVAIRNAIAEGVREAQRH